MKEFVKWLFKKPGLASINPGPKPVMPPNQMIKEGEVKPSRSGPPPIAPFPLESAVTQPPWQKKDNLANSKLFTYMHSSIPFMPDGKLATDGSKLNVGVTHDGRLDIECKDGFATTNSMYSKELSLHFAKTILKGQGKNTKKRRIKRIR